MTDNNDGTANIALRSPDTDEYIQTLPESNNDTSNITWNTKPSYQPVDDKGNPISVNSNALYTSTIATSNGKWLLLWSEHNYFTRINLNTFQATSAEVPIQGDITDIYAETAITEDGRYVATSVMGGDNATLWITDLSNCNPNGTGLMTDPIECNARSLTYTLNKDGLLTFRMPKFYNDDVLSIYSSSSYDGNYDLYFIQAPHTKSPTSYIALGDSYASGEGTFDYYPPTNSSYNTCHLSPKSYPYLLQHTLELDSTHSVACSGAEIININGGELEAAQFDSSKKPKHTPLGAWLPGYKRQLDFVSTYHPNISTISIGGNDIGFKHVIERCIEPGTCYGSYEDRMGLILNINNQFNRLVSLYESIKSNSAPGAKLYVVGYPQIITPGSDCGHFGIGLNSSEIGFANKLINYLDDVIQQAAERAGVGYVNTENTFNGYRLCSGTSDPAVNGMSQRDPLHASFHPTQFGHSLLADSIKSSTKNFTSVMPAPNRSIKEPNPSYEIPLLDVPKSDKTVRTTEFDNSTRNLVVRSEPINGELQGNNYNLKPDANYSVSIHSIPKELGVVTTDNNGLLKYSLKIPSSIKSGFHTIHIYGEDTDNQSIDIQRTIYLVASKNDLDDVKTSKDQVCQILGIVGTDVNNVKASSPCVKNTPLSSTQELYFNTKNNSTLDTVVGLPNVYIGNTTPSSSNGHTNTMTKNPKTTDNKLVQDQSLNYIYLAGVIVLIATLLVYKLARHE